MQPGITNSCILSIQCNLEALDVGGRIILKLILEKCDGVVGTGFIWLRIGISGVVLCPIKCWKIV
jgi:hypothetical protein